MSTAQTSFRGLPAVPLPPVDYFASVLVSFPLIGLTQFTQYLVAACMSGLSPAELLACFSGASGHSQGFLMAKNDVSFIENVQKALMWLFFAGLQGQQLFPIPVL
jgi:fatty acid synthase subunit alpha, fungi type